MWDPKTVTVVELFQAALLALELGALEPRSQILGGICIFDMEGINLSHLRHLTTKIASQIVNIIVVRIKIVSFLISSYNINKFFFISSCFILNFCY